MAPVSYERSHRRFRGGFRDDTFDDYPLDPFWEYVLGDGEAVETQRSRKYFHQKQNDRSDTFLDNLFPVDGGSRKSRSSSRKPRAASTSSVAAANTAKRSKFWRRKNQSKKSSTASWFDEDRNERSTSRGAGGGSSGGGGGLFKRSKPQPDPFGLLAAKGSFDSFIEHYYGSDVETSEEEIASKVQQKRQSNVKKSLSKSNSVGDGFLSNLKWDHSNSKKTKQRRFLSRKDKNESSISSPLSSLFTKPSSTGASSSTFTNLIKPSTSKSASLGSSNRSTKREQRVLQEHGERNMSPLERFVETFDAFGDVTTSDEDEYSTSVSSDDVEDEDDDDDEGSSSFDSSYASASYSYATEVTDEDTNYTSAPSDTSRKETVGNKSQRNSSYMSQSRSKGQRSVSTSGASNQRDMNEVRLKYTPARTKKASPHSSQKRLLPPMIGDDDEESGSPSVGLAGESLESRGGFTERYDDEEDTGDMREDLTISTRETLPTESCSNRVPFAEESYGSSLPDILPKAVANGDRSKVNDDDSALERSRMILSRNHNLVGKIVCCSVKDLTPAQQQKCREMGIAIHELTPEELEEIFPKVRSISEDIPLSRHRSCVIGNSRSFEKDFPAHLQAIVQENGPQSLYEYEYEKGTHKVLVYEEFGTDPRSSLRVHISEKPPMLFREGFQDDNKVIIQVEASTVSHTDCLIRQGRWAGVGDIPLPNSPGVDVVGKIYSIGEAAAKKFGIDVGQRVVALTQYGGNARYLAVNASQFVKVPENVDPAEAACLTETYLTAFQALHYGQSPGVRYRRTGLKGKQLLIIGTISSNMGQALSQLSSAASVDNLYATSKQKHYQRLSSLGILPLSTDPLHWFDRLKGKVDLIISFDEEVTPLHFKVLTSAGEAIIITSDGSDPGRQQDTVLRSRSGKLACRREASHNRSRLHGYNVYNAWETDLDRCKRDLEHLIHLLDKRWVVPEVLDRIPLNKVPRAQELLESKNIPGFIVCEPWIISKSRAVLL